MTSSSHRTFTAAAATLALAASAAPAFAAPAPGPHQQCTGVTLSDCERQVLASRGIGAPAELVPVSASATADGNGSKRAGKSRQAERLRQTERRRLQALVDADVAVAGPLHASDFELINPLGEVLTGDTLLGAVGTGTIDFLSDAVTSPIRVRLRGSAAVLRYRHTVDIRVTGVGHLTHPAWTTALYERRNGRWQIVWEQTGAIGPLPLPSPEQR